MGRVFILHLKNENKVITEADAFREADKQEKSGISPRYAWRDNKTGEPITPPGWLVWSTYADGVGVVYRRPYGKAIILTGWQGDFCIIKKIFHTKNICAHCALFVL